MTIVDDTITALRTLHDELAGAVAGISDEQLTGPSGASEWTVAQVLSHLGSGAEITLGTLGTAVNGSAPAEDNQTIWDRWNASSPREQADGFVEHDERLVAFVEALTPEQRESVMVDMGFLPEPVPLSTALGMRLNEVVAHSWDARVGVDPEAEIAEDSSRLVLDHFSDGLGFLLGFTGKADQLSQQAIVAVDGYAILVDEGVRIAPGASGGETATFSGPLGAAVRLLSGRLTPARTPEGVEVTGNVSLDDLRQVFQGY